MLTTKKDQGSSSLSSPGSSGSTVSAGASTADRSRSRRGELRELDFAGGAALLSPEPLQHKAAAHGHGEAATEHSASANEEEGNPIVERVNAYQTHIDEAARTWGVSAASIKAMIATESAGLADAQNGSYRGLLQVGPSAWAAVLDKKPEWKDWAFDDKWSDPRCNILVGTGYRMVVKKELDAGLAESGLTISDDEALIITKMSYNAGAGTISMAMKRAKSSVIAEFTKREHLAPAVEDKKIHVGYLKNELASWLASNGKAYGVEETTRDAVKKAHDGKLSEAWFTANGQAAVYEASKKTAIDKKCAEITSYGPKITGWIETFGGEPAKNDGPKGGTIEGPGADPVVPPTPEPAPSASPTLSELVLTSSLGLGDGSGATSDRLRACNELRRALREGGYSSVAESGPFDENLKRVVEVVQTSLGLPPTGAVDAETWRKVSNQKGDLKLLNHARYGGVDVARFEALAPGAQAETLSEAEAIEFENMAEQITALLRVHNFRARGPGFGERERNLLRGFQRLAMLSPSGQLDAVTYEYLLKPIAEITAIRSKG